MRALLRIRISDHPFRNIDPLTFLMPSAKSSNIMNKNIVEHLNRNNRQNDNRYGFCSVNSTANVLTVIIQRICEALDNRFVMRPIVLDISKTFDKVQLFGCGVCYINAPAMETMDGFSQLSSPC